MLEPTSELNLYYKVYLLLQIYPEDDLEDSLPYEKTIRDAFSTMQEDEELPRIFKHEENVEEDEDFSLILDEVEEPEKPLTSVIESQKSSPVTGITDELTLEFADYVTMEEAKPGTTPPSVFEGIEAKPVFIKTVPPDEEYIKLKEPEKPPASVFEGHPVDIKTEPDDWEAYVFIGILSQQQLDDLIEDVYRNSLTWWSTPTVIDDNPFPVVKWYCNYPEGNLRFVLARLMPPTADVESNTFKNTDAFLSFIQKRYAATHEPDCRCEGCQETKKHKIVSD